MITVKKSLGIELREDELVLSCVRRGLRRWSLSNFKIINYYWQFNRDDLEKELLAFIAKNSISREDIVLGVPRDKVIVRFLELPREVEDNIKQVIKYQVETLTPVEDELPYYDFAVLNKNTDSAKLAILLVMIKRGVLDKYLNFLNEVRIFPNVVQISCVGLYNFFLLGKNALSDQTYIVFDANEGNLELMAIRNRQLLYSKLIRLQNGPPSVDLMLGEIETALSNLSIEEGQIEKVYFSGKATETLFEEFKTKIGDSVLLCQDLPQGSNGHLQPFLLNALMPSIGLALGALPRRPPLSINLLPENKRVTFRRVSYIPTLILLLAVAGLVATLSLREFFQQRGHNAALDAELAKLKPDIEKVKKIRKDVQATEQRIKFLEGHTNKPEQSLDLLKELTVKLPDAAYLQSVTISNKGDINLSGSTGISCTSLIQHLDKSAYLKEVELSSCYKEPSSGKEKFTIKAKLKEK